MIKYYSQLLVLIGVCMVLGQGISEEVAGQTGKDSAVALSDTTVISQDAISKNDTAVITTAKDTTDATLKDSTVVVGDSSKSDSVKEIPNIIVADTTKYNIPEPAIATVEGTRKEKGGNPQTFGGRSGIGINLLVKLFNSKEINNFLEDVYYMWIDDFSGTIKKKPEFSPMVSMMGVNLKGIVFVGPVVGFEPFGFVSFGNSLYRVRDYYDGREYDHDVDVSLIDVGSGINIWARVAPKKHVSFKAGLGGYVCYSALNVDGYAGEVQFTGVGYGVNILAGIDITIRKITVNIDFLLPVGATELDQDGSFQNIGSSRTIRYPSEYAHNGFVIRPGVTFQF
jgi:hypothetical protein